MIQESRSNTMHQCISTDSATVRVDDRRATRIGFCGSRRTTEKPLNLSSRCGPERGKKKNLNRVTRAELESARFLPRDRAMFMAASYNTQTRSTACHRVWDGTFVFQPRTSERNIH